MCGCESVRVLKWFLVPHAHRVTGHTRPVHACTHTSWGDTGTQYHSRIAAIETRVVEQQQHPLPRTCTHTWHEHTSTHTDSTAATHVTAMTPRQRCLHCAPLTQTGTLYEQLQVLPPRTTQSLLAGMRDSIAVQAGKAHRND